MTVGSQRGRGERAFGSATRRGGVRCARVGGGGPRVAAGTFAACVAVLLCLFFAGSCGAADPPGDVSRLYEETAGFIAPEKTPDATAASSSGLRGAIQSDTFSDNGRFEIISPVGKCSYECCSSFLDVLPQHDGRFSSELEIREDSLPIHKNSDQRMLQVISNNGTNPCPSGNGESESESESESEGGIGVPVAVQYVLIVILVMFSALFSGLTLGLMSLDPSGLEIVMANSDDPRMARAAKAIYPVRLNGNLLLCTLLLGNVGVNSMLSILMADLTSGLVGFIVSTCVIVVFGEIIPQALCSRYALVVGEKTVPLVKFIMILLYPICKPLSVILNWVLGHEIGTTYSASEMAKLIEMHVQRGDLEDATGAAMKGALRYRGVAVEEAMTPIENTFMLSADERLGFDTVAKIFKTGYSRIPVYEVSMSNIIGLLFVKDLIFLDPEDEIPVKNFVQIFGRTPHIVWPNDKLSDVLKLLKRGRSHLALVRDVNHGDGTMDPFYEIKGIITLEDIIEMILGDEIVDETDELVDVNDPASIVKRSDVEDYNEDPHEKSDNSPNVGERAGDECLSRSMDWEARLRLLDERLVDEHLSADEVRAVAAHLKTNYSRAVELISDRQLKDVLSSVPVTEIPPASTCATDDIGDCNGVPTDSSELIYERGVPTKFCTVILSGKIMVMSGADRFRSDVSNWGVLADRVLTNPDYTPDFSAWVVPNQNHSGGCRCIKLDRESYGQAVDNTALEKIDHKVDPAQSSVAATGILRNGSPSLNGSANTESQQKSPGCSVNLAVDNKLQKSSGHNKSDSPLSKSESTSLPDKMSDISADKDRTQFHNRWEIQKERQSKRHSRRSMLLKAFSRATRDAEK